LRGAGLPVDVLELSFTPPVHGEREFEVEVIREEDFPMLQTLLYIGAGICGAFVLVTCGKIINNRRKGKFSKLRGQAARLSRLQAGGQMGPNGQMMNQYGQPMGQMGQPIQAGVPLTYQQQQQQQQQMQQQQQRYSAEYSATHGGQMPLAHAGQQMGQTGQMHTQMNQSPGQQRTNAPQSQQAWQG